MADESRQEGKIKVTDKRMFTADGELREDFQHLEGASAEDRVEEPAAAAPAEAERPAESESGASESPRAAPVTDRAGDEVETLGPSALGEPGLVDLVGVLAEPIAIYLGDAQLPDGRSAENLDAARFYIDLLEVLRTKTAGNLTVEETSVLDDLLYQLRMRYVRKRG